MSRARSAGAGVSCCVLGAVCCFPPATHTLMLGLQALSSSFLLQGSRPKVRARSLLPPLHHPCSGFWRCCLLNLAALTPELGRAHGGGSPLPWRSSMWRPLQGSLRPQLTPRAQSLVQAFLVMLWSSPRWPKSLLYLQPHVWKQRTQFWIPSVGCQEMEPVASVPKWGGYLLPRAAGSRNPWPHWMTPLSSSPCLRSRPLPLPLSSLLCSLKGSWEHRGPLGLLKGGGPVGDA